jgi:hypothetical protein
MSVANTASRSGEITATLDDFDVRGHPLIRVFRSYFPLFLILWILFVLYPNPLKLIVSVQRVFDFDAEPGSVEFILSDFPSDPAAIEDTVLARIPYHYDWELYGVPWYFPTIKEVLQKGEGDCKARALVLASIFEARNIPYRVNVSPIHIWVDYKNKGETSIENAKVKFYQQDPETGESRFQFPEIDLKEVTDSFWQGFWIPMPDGRKALLISGLLALVAARVVLFKNKARG